MLEHLQGIQKKLGVQFKSTEILQSALTHSSYVHERKLALAKSNERLEFLGDAVLSLCIAEMLSHAFPDEPEGALSKRRAALVNQRQLSKLALKLELGPALRLGKGEEKTGGRTKASLLGDAVEAVIGAVYVDQGLEVVKKIIHELFAELLPDSKKVETSEDYKTRLQEYFQKIYKKSPRYLLIKETGPDHSKTFHIQIEFSGKKLGQGEGRSKREAEQAAARSVLKELEESLEKSIQEKNERKRSRKKASRKAAPVIDRMPDSKGEAASDASESKS